MNPEPDPRKRCHTYWRSHGCGYPRGHAGRQHVCDPCPPGCDAPREPDMMMEVLASHCDDCTVHCGDQPTITDVFYGEDAPRWQPVRHAARWLRYTGPVARRRHERGYQRRLRARARDTR